MPLKIKFCPVCGFRFVTPTETDRCASMRTKDYLRGLGNRFEVWRCPLCDHLDFFSWNAIEKINIDIRWTL